MQLFDWSNIHLSSISLFKHYLTVRLRSLTSNHLPVTAVGSNPDWQGSWTLPCEEAVHLAYWMKVVSIRCPSMPEIMHKRHFRSASTFRPILNRCDLKPNQTYIIDSWPIYYLAINVIFLKCLISHTINLLKCLLAINKWNNKWISI
jgi:hypothetical protein